MNACLIRHTQVQVDAGVCYGRTDVPLAESFETEAAAVRRVLPWVPDVIWTSPSARCRLLAERLAGARTTVVADARLMELNFGEWEGRRWESFRGPVSEAWALDPWGRRPPGGESGKELWERVAAVRMSVLSQALRVRVAVVTHAGVIRLWKAQAQGRMPDASVFSTKIGFGDILEAD